VVFPAPNGGFVIPKKTLYPVALETGDHVRVGVTETLLLPSAGARLAGGNGSWDVVVVKLDIEPWLVPTLLEAHAWK
jgi:hypothetical protein